MKRSQTPRQPWQAVWATGTSEDGQGLEKWFASFRLVWTKHAQTGHPGNLHAGTVLSQENRVWLPAGPLAVPDISKDSRSPSRQGLLRTMACALKGSSNWAGQRLTTDSLKDSQICQWPRIRWMEIMWCLLLACFWLEIRWNRWLWLKYTWSVRAYWELKWKAKLQGVKSHDLQQIYTSLHKLKHEFVLILTQTQALGMWAWGAKFKGDTYKLRCGQLHPTVKVIIRPNVNKMIRKNIYKKRNYSSDRKMQ